jgi:putative SOS response-associated peptidase YedK
MTVGRDLAKAFQLSEEPDLEPRYNIAPTQLVAIVRNEQDPARGELKLVKWGLVPFWAKDTKFAARLINARAESAPKKPAFRSAFKSRRCLIPADGFYEWKKTGNKKTPYFIGRADGRPLAFAGLWEHWKSPEGEIVETCTILTVDANDALRSLHDRMPAILDPDDYDKWLDPGATADELKSLLRSFPGGEMVVRQASERCNKATYDAPDCIESEGGLGLFEHA